MSGPVSASATPTRRTEWVFWYTTQEVLEASIVQRDLAMAGDDLERAEEYDRWVRALRHVVARQSQMASANLQALTIQDIEFFGL